MKMPVQTQTVFVVKQTVDVDWQLLTPILFPGYSRLALNGDLPAQFKKRLKEQVAAIRNSNRYRSILTETPTVRAISVTLPPPQTLKRKLYWQSAIEIDFDVICWSHHQEGIIGFVPALGIEVIQAEKNDQEFDELLADEILGCLQRERKLVSLRNLLEYERFEKTEIVPLDVEYELLSPKEEVIATNGAKDESETLNKIGVLIEPARRPAGHLLDENVDRLAEILFGKMPQSALLVGPSGVGKSSLVIGLARKKFELNQGAVEFWETAGSRIVAGMSGFGQWQERCQNLVDELAKKNAVLHLGNLFELLHVGKSVSQNQGIASFLRPSIERGSIRVTAELLPEQIALIEKEEPQLLQAFHRMDIQVPAAKQVVAILKAEANSRKSWAQLKIDDEAIRTLYEIHHKYAAYSAMPGRPVQFLRKLIDDSPKSARISSEEVIAQFSKETGLPYFLLSQAVPLNVDQTAEWFSGRVIGQATPVELVVDMLAAVKANLTPQGKPIASFLFIGPTGVGKTEMAKSITQFMFGDSQKMIRFDMSEFSNPLSIERLIGGSADNEGLLTSRIRQSPFSLLLFDEFEKAHPSFFDLLLQILGEGRLTDSRGRITDFSTTIVVMTSNLGAESLKDQPLGFVETGLNADRSQAHFTKEVQEFVRPELYNRIDRIVPFSPLDDATATLVTRREIEKLKRREGVWFRPIDLAVDESAIEFIASNGQSRRYGARPIQRYIQDQVVVPVASKLNRHPANLEVQVQVTTRDGKLVVETGAKHVVHEMQHPKNTNSDPVKVTFYEGIRMIRQQRRRAQSLSRSSLADRVRNEQFRQQQQLSRMKKIYQRLVRKGSNADESDSVNWQLLNKEREVARFEKVIGAIDEIESQAIQQEQSILTGFFCEQRIESAELRDAAFELKREINRALFDLFVFDSTNHEKVTVALYGKSFSILNHMVDGYLSVAKNRDYRVRRFVLRKYRADQKNKANFSLKRTLTGAEKFDEGQTPAEPGSQASSGPDEPSSANQNSQPREHLLAANVFACEEFDQVEGKDLMGVAMELSGPAAFPLFAAESGIHHFKNPSADPVFVEVFGHGLFQHDLPSEFATGARFERDQKCREYNLSEKTVADRILGKRGYVNLTLEIQSTLESALQSHLDKVVGSWN